MSELSTRYGFMREIEADFVDKLLDTIQRERGLVKFLEIGVFGGGTVSGIARWCNEHACPVFATGVDFAEWKPNPVPLPDYDFHACDSMDAWRKMPGAFRYNLLLIDGCHCVNHSMCDFLHYSTLLDVHGYCLFHDTALPKGGTEQGEWPQYHGYAGQPDSKLGVRDGLKKMGLLQGYRADWKLIEEIPSDDGLMGMCLFQKLKEL